MREIGIDTETTDITKICDQLEDYLQTHGIDNDEVNEEGKHCEIILDRIADLDSMNKKELYTYASVVYLDDIVAQTIKEPTFYYKTDLPVKVGDIVLVDRNGHNTMGEIVRLEYRDKDNVPYPLEKTKDIIEIMEEYSEDE
jgi:hypothetical protein